MSKLTISELMFYVKSNCTVEVSPRCSDCNTNYGDIYLDELHGDLFCIDCLQESLNKDPAILEELRIDIKEKELK